MPGECLTKRNQPQTKLPTLMFCPPLYHAPNSKQATRPNRYAGRPPTQMESKTPHPSYRTPRQPPPLDQPTSNHPDLDRGLT